MHIVASGGQLAAQGAYMPGTRRRDRVYHARLSELDVLEDRMGRLASILSTMADGRSEYPESLNLRGGGVAVRSPNPDAVTIRAAEWPTFEEIQKLVTRWRIEQARLADVPTAPVVHRRLERG